MSNKSSGSQSITSSSFEARETVAEQTRSLRKDYIRNEKGDIIGGDYHVPKGDFARFLGYKPPTEQELKGQVGVSSQRVVEIALQKEMNELGSSATSSGSSYMNLFVAGGQMKNSLGKDQDQIKELFTAHDQALSNPKISTLLRPSEALANTAPKPSTPEERMERIFKAQNEIQSQSVQLNLRYLEMQYKLQEMSKQDSTISNLMKVRHDAVTRVIRDSH